MLDVYECDTTTRDAIDIYDWRLQLMPAAEAPIDTKSQADALPPDDSNDDLHRDTSYGNDGGWSMGSKVEIWRTGSLGCFLFLSSLLFGSRPSTNGVGMGFYHLPMVVEFPHTPDPPKGRHWAVPVGCGTYGFVRLCTSNDDLITPFHSLLLYRLLRPRRFAPKEGDNVTATWPEAG